MYLDFAWGYLPACFCFLNVPWFMFFLIHQKNYTNKKTFPKMGRLKKSVYLSHRNILIQVNILNGLQHFHTFFKRSLKCFSTKYQTHSPCSFINNSSCYCFLHITLTFTLANGIDQTNSSNITI